MQDDYLFDLNAELNKHNILISFSGPFYQSLIEELGVAIRGYVQAQKNDKGLINNLFTVFIEQSQNIRNYLTALPDPKHRLSGIIVIGNKGDHFFVRSGNVVRDQDVPSLRQKLESLQGLDKEALKSLYRDQIRREIGPDDKSAGLGLIDMARKAQEPLEYHFSQIQDGYHFYTLSVTV